MQSRSEYQRHNAAVERRIAKHFGRPAEPHGRVELPGQLELPDTEPRPSEVAKRQAAAPLRATVHQKPCDMGLFSDAPKQVDLEDLL